MGRLYDKILPVLIISAACWRPLGAVAPPARGVVPPPGFAEFAARRNLEYSGNLRKAAGTAPGPLLAAGAPRRLAVPVLLASYADRGGTIGPEDFHSRLFGTFPTGSMKDYYGQASRGLLELEGVVYGWVSTPLSQAGYTAGGPLGRSSAYPESPEGFVADAVRSADRLLDYGKYDNDGPDGVPNSGDDDGVVDALLVVHPGGDAASGDEANLWSHTGRLGEHAVETGDPAAGGGRIRVDLYSLVPELSRDGSAAIAAEIGVFCHELGHQLGLVDLYDTSVEDGAGAEAVSNGIGAWGLMGHGSYGGDGASPQSPTHPCAWSKLRLGWVTAVMESETGQMCLPPVDTEGLVARLWDNDNRGFGYFLLSCRGRRGFDSRLPGEGLMIWHVDESVPDNNDPLHPLVDLEEADGLRDLEQGVNLGDGGDPFPGSTGNTGFATLTVPSSQRYDRAASGVAVSGIRLENGQACFQLDQPERSGLTLAYDQSPPEPEGFGYGDNLAYGAVVFSAPVDGVLEAVATFFVYREMSYQIELYTGETGGVMGCRIHEQSGKAAGRGWQTLELERPVLLEAGDTLVAVIGYTSRGFDEGRPVPYDASRRAQGRSLVDYFGLGAFEPFGHDLSIRAVLNTDYQDLDYRRVQPMLALEKGLIDLGRVFSGETYGFGLMLSNPGARNTRLERIEVSGEGFSLGDPASEVPCGSRLEVPLGFAADVPGGYSGTVTVVPAVKSLPALDASLTAEVAGYSLRYDSAGTPGGYLSYTGSAHGAVIFSMPLRGLLCGVRVYLLHSLMSLRLKVWAEVSGGRPRCLVAEAATDSPLQGSGWHQLFLDAPVDADSGDTFIADVEFALPGESWLDLVPVDTLTVSQAVSFYNRREGESWLTSPHPVSIRALIVPPEPAPDGEVILKRPAAGVSSPLSLPGLKVGETATGGFWLVNQGTSRYRATVSLADSGGAFSLEQTAWEVPCLDSVFVPVRCLPASPGTDSARVLVATTDREAPGLEVQLYAAVERFGLAYDEQGFTATAGFGAPAAWVAVRFSTTWPGLLESLEIYLNRPGMQVDAVVYGSMEAPGVFLEPLAHLADSLAEPGWQSVRIDPPLYFAAGDSFVAVASLTEPEGGRGYPLSLDTRGEPSGRSWASRSLEGPWEALGHDLNLRAGFRTTGSAGIAVSGLLRESSGEPLAGAVVMLDRAGSSYRAFSDSAGAFLFGSVAPGHYLLSASLDGYRFEPPELQVAVVGSAPGGLVLVGYRLVPGDLDLSGRLDIFDLIRLLQVLAGVVPADSGTDLDGSGSTDIFDLIRLLQLLAG